MSFVAAMLADGDLARAKRIGQPAGDHRHHPLMVADVSFVHAWHGGMANFMRHNSEEVARNGVRVEVDDLFAKICHAFAQLLGRWALHLDRPPFSIELEAQRWPLTAPAWGAGGLHVT